MTRKVALNDALRNTRNPSIYVDWQTLHGVFPALTHDRLRQWAHRGHVPTQPGGFIRCGPSVIVLTMSRA